MLRRVAFLAKSRDRLARPTDSLSYRVWVNSEAVTWRRWRFVISHCPITLYVVQRLVVTGPFMGQFTTNWHTFYGTRNRRSNEKIAPKNAVRPAEMRLPGRFSEISWVQKGVNFVEKLPEKSSF